MASLMALMVPLAVTISERILESFPPIGRPFCCEYMSLFAVKYALFLRRKSSASRKSSRGIDVDLAMMSYLSKII